MAPKLDIDCVIPAAGLSSRMGTHKLLVDFGGKLLLRWAVDHALAACRTVIVVSGHEDPQVRVALPAHPRLRVVTNADYRRGMFSSIARGAAEVSTSWFFVAPADMPFITPELYRSVAREAAVSVGGATAGEGPTAWIPQAAGLRGHPVLICSRIVPALTDEAGTDAPPRPMHQFLSSYETRIVPVEDDGAIIDIDTMAELELYAPRAEGLDT